jgi:hypothetical protein
MHCPYGTYQRALSSHGMSIAKGINDPAKFREAMISRLSPEARKRLDIVDAFVKSAREHLENDFDIMLSFRL